MKFHKAIDIWAIPQYLLKHLPAGQWVRAGRDGPLGRFYGVRPSGVVVVAWKGNANASGRYFDYCRSLHQYAHPTNTELRRAS